MDGIAQIMLMLTLSLNLTEDSKILMEQKIFGETSQITQTQEDSSFKGCALVLKDNTLVYDSLDLNEEICTFDKGTLVFYEDRGSVFYVHNNDIGGFLKKDTVAIERISETADNLGLSSVVKPSCVVNLFSNAGYEGELLRKVKPFEELEFLDEQDDFYLVTDGEYTGFVEKRYVRKTFKFTPIVIEEDDSENCITDLWNTQLTKKQAIEIIRNSCTDEYSQGTRVALDAVNYVGNKYVWGGNSLDNGVDCSGFVKQLYLKTGVSLPRVSRYQACSNLDIAEEELQPGDLVFYDKQGIVNHVALYIGQGYVIHASNKQAYPKGGIKISKMRYREPCKYVRVMGE